MAEPFLPTDLRGPVLLVVPEGMAAAARPLQQAIGALGGRPELLEGAAFEPAHFADFQVIACGHRGNNAALRRLYAARRVFADTFFPGPGGYLVTSVADPFGHRRNVIAVGSSDAGGLVAGVRALAEVVAPCGGRLDRVHRHRLAHPLPPPPAPSEAGGLVQQALATWNGGWQSSPFRSSRLREFLWHFYLTDEPGWGRLIPPILAGSLEPWRAERRAHPEDYHAFFLLHHFIQLWDLVEDSPLYTAADRQQAARLFAELLAHQAGLFYLREEVTPTGDLRQNHATFIALNLAVGHEYLCRRHGQTDLAAAAGAAERIFRGQAGCYKPDDDAGVGYAWLVPRATHDFLALQDDPCFLEEGQVARLCTLAALTTDNLRSEVSYGDVAGFVPGDAPTWDERLWPLLVSLSHRPDPGHLWLLNWLGRGKKPTLWHSLAGLYAAVEFAEDGFRLGDCVARQPDELLGICVLTLPPAARHAVARRVPAAHHPAPGRTYFDKLSLRSSFDPEDEYVLLEGLGTFSHGHEDTNAILRLTWRRRAWLADGDYIRAAPKYHNAVVVCRDGVGVHLPPGDGVVIPPLAALVAQHEGPLFGLVQTEAAHYNGLDWRRSLCWRRGRFLAVIDQLQCRVAGQYELRCHWRLVGQVEQGEVLRLRQQEEQFHLHQASPGAWEVVSDPHEGGLWRAYPHADPVIEVVHQTQDASLAPGENRGFLNLFTPHPEVQVERLGNLLLRVVDGDSTCVVGAGPLHLEDLRLTGAVFALSLDGEQLTLQGAEQVEVRRGARIYTETYQGACRTLDPHSPVGRRLLQLLRGQPALPTTRPPLPSRPPAGGFRPRWTTPLAATTASVGAGSVALGTAAGDLHLLDLETGAPQWQARLETPATCLHLCQAGAPALLAGTADSQLVVLEQGREAWRRPLRNMGGPSPVTALAAADLDGSGKVAYLAGNAGWYVNAFAADGTPLWANWFRYHPITALAAADVDGDGRAEIIAGNVYCTPLTVHNGDGSFRWSTYEQVGAHGNATTPRRGIHLTDLCLWDADGDGFAEVAYGTADGWLYLVNPRDGAACWHHSLVAGVQGLALIAGGLVVASEYGHLCCFDGQGRLRWRHRHSRWLRRLVAGPQALVIETEAGLLSCDLDGNPVGFLPLQTPATGLWSCAGGVLLATTGAPLTAFDLTG